MTIVVGSSGGLPRLAADLTFPANKDAAAQTYNTLTVAVVAGVSTTTLSLSGKWAVSRLFYTNLISEANTYYMEVDGVPIWNDIGAAGITFALYGLNAGTGNAFGDPAFIVNSSLILKITTVTDTSVDITYDARPIL